MFFLQQHTDLFRKMLNDGVDFLIIGGYAVNYYGYSRMTEDIDLWLRPDNGNRDRFISVLLSSGFTEMGIKKLQNLDFSEMVSFHIGERPERIDFITKINGVVFEQAWPDRETLIVDNIPFPFISFDHLILSKISNERLRDQADIQELHKIREIRENSRETGK